MVAEQAPQLAQAVSYEPLVFDLAIFLILCIAAVILLGWAVLARERRLKDIARQLKEKIAAVPADQVSLREQFETQLDYQATVIKGLVIDKDRLVQTVVELRLRRPDDQLRKLNEKMQNINSSLAARLKTTEAITAQRETELAQVRQVCERLKVELEAARGKPV